MASDNFSPIAGSQPVEYGKETSYAGELPSATDYNWFGITTSWSVDQGVESESITYLPEAGASNKLEKRVNVKLREMYEADLTYHPQSNFDFLEYFTGKIGGTSDQVPSLQAGEIEEENDEYRRLRGGVGEEVTISVEEDGVAEIDTSWIFGEANSWNTVDYIGDGINTTISITPDSDEISVDTSSIDTGEIVFYDTDDKVLDIVDASTTSPQNTSEVGGTTVEGFQLRKVGSTVTDETINFYTDVDGGGTSSTADYSIEGSHADEDTTEPWSYDNLGSVKYGGEELDGSVDSIELSISNDLAVVRDANSDLSTQIEFIQPVDREITVDVEFTYDNFDILEEVRSYTAKDFEFTLGNTTFTIGGVKFPEIPYSYEPDDLVADSLTSDPASSISWTSA
jgi:hypothetical protein